MEESGNKDQKHGIHKNDDALKFERDPITKKGYA